MIKVSEKAGTMIKNFLEEQKDPHTVSLSALMAISSAPTLMSLP